MDASVPEPAERSELGPGVLAGAGAAGAVPCRSDDSPGVENAEASGAEDERDRHADSGADHRGSGVHIVLAPGVPSHDGYFVVLPEDRLLHVHVHLVSRDLPALPLRPTNESGLEGSAAAGA